MAGGDGGGMIRILLVDDDPQVLELVGFILRREGYEVITAQTGEEALTLARQHRPHLVILDIMLPGTDGFEVCRRLRYWGTMPILMLTAKAADFDKVRGLDLGADDYITKPFSPLELLARVRAHLRRQQLAPAPPASRVVIGGLVIDFQRRRVEVDGRLVTLTPSEFQLLSCLAAAPGRPHSPQALLRQAYNYDYSPAEAANLVRVKVRRLRWKLGEDPEAPRYLITVRGQGYALVDPGQTPGDRRPAEATEEL